MALDTGFKNILITGDFNDNQMNPANQKLKTILQTLNLFQLITKPTSITENSSTIIDLVITNNPDLFVYCDVVEPFLDVQVRYHCPVVSLLKMDKPRSNSFKRQVWLYDRADFGAYKNNLLVTDWDSIVNGNKQLIQLHLNLPKN